MLFSGIKPSPEYIVAQLRDDMLPDALNPRLAAADREWAARKAATLCQSTLRDHPLAKGNTIRFLIISLAQCALEAPGFEESQREEILAFVQQQISNRKNMGRGSELHGRLTENIEAWRRGQKSGFLFGRLSVEKACALVKDGLTHILDETAPEKRRTELARAAIVYAKAGFNEDRQAKGPIVRDLIGSLADIAEHAPGLTNKERESVFTLVSNEIGKRGYTEDLKLQERIDKQFSNWRNRPKASAARPPGTE